MKLIAFLILVSTAFAGRDFNSLGRAMESNYANETQLRTRYQPLQAWNLFVKVVSRKSGERGHIYARQSHRDHELLITTLERMESRR